MHVLLSLTAAAVVVLVSPLQSQSSASLSPTPSSGAAVFQPGDAVRVTVWRNPDLSGQFDIGEDGTIVHPLYRTVRAAGISIAQVEAEIRGVLQRFEANPELVVEPLFRISISGQVRSPNLYTLSPATTVVQAITQAGGATDRANTSRVRLMRDGKLIPVDLTLPAHELSHLRIRSGDQIVVDARRNVWTDQVRPIVTTLGATASLIHIFLRYRYYR